MSETDSGIGARDSEYIQSQRKLLLPRNPTPLYFTSTQVLAQSTSPQITIAQQ